MAERPPTSGFSRRALLKGGLASLALLGLSGTGIALRGTRLRPLPADGLMVFSPAEYSILAAVAERVCPPPDDKTPSATQIDVARIADRFLVAAEDDVVDGVKSALHILENALTGALFFERVTPFTALSPADQDRTLLAFQRSRVKVRQSIFRALVGMCASLYSGDPRTFPSVGYPGPPNPQAMRQTYAAQLVDYAALRATKKQGG